MKKLSRNSNRKKRLEDPKRVLKTIKGVLTKRNIRILDTIASVNASNTFAFSVSSSNYMGLYRLTNTSEFNEMAASYQAFRIVALELEIIKTISESRVNTVIPTGLPAFYFTYYPILTSSTVSASIIQQNDASLTVSPQEYSVKVKRYDMPSLTAYISNAGQTYGVKLNDWLPTTTLTNVFPGEVVVGYTGTGNASSAEIIFNVRLTAQMEFLYPY